MRLLLFMQTSTQKASFEKFSGSSKIMQFLVPLFFFSLDKFIFYCDLSNVVFHPILAVTFNIQEFTL